MYDTSKITGYLYSFEEKTKWEKKINKLMYFYIYSQSFLDKVEIYINSH